MSIIGIIYYSPELKSCPIQTTFETIEKRTVQVIKEMFRGITRFNHFLEKIEGIT